ncbi:sugar ABC transporter substrate-binding protein [Pseudonocardia sp. DSM 110487]|uniref:ABC transporter substrate-binding protein n=1 Tax=Pseudonocardia sp. DSM 110487 TaxID=2865833 RepID=UPI001C697F81|nr:sugar ABC transporter substrate-binding protein [Pseudonocardia sp. DSM 110487]QYN32719.1 sugar ABC transporter substrate-binding protein [Pseudonocardia sp. DSM 110487]
MPHRLTRRDLLKVAALTGLLAGCGSRPDGAATWSMWSSSPEEAEVWANFSQYVEQRLGVRSVPNLTPSNGYPTKLDLQLVSGTASLVTAINGQLLPTYAARGALRPLDDLIAADPDFDADDFYPPIRAISSFAGRPYMVGFDVAPNVLYVNKTLLAERGIDAPSLTEPMTWARFRELAIELSAPPDRYGFTSAPDIDNLISWIYCAGGNVMNADATAGALDEPEAMEAFDFLVGLFVRDKVTPPITSLVPTNARANFMEGNVAFMQNGPWQVVNVRKAEFEWDIVPFPAGPAGSMPRVSGSGFAIPAAVGGADLELAWTLLKTLTSTGALNIYAGAGRNNPARYSAGSAFQPPPANVGIVQRILAGEIAGGHPFEVTTNWNQIKQMLDQDLPRGFLGQLTPAEVVAGLTPRLDVLMTQHQDNVRLAELRK